MFVYVDFFYMQRNIYSISEKVKMHGNTQTNLRLERITSSYSESYNYFNGLTVSLYFKDILKGKYG